MAKQRKKLNINRVRHFLYKKYKYRFGFKTWDDTLFRGRQVLDELKNYQLTDSQKNIRHVVNIIKPPKPRKKKDEVTEPILPQEAFEPTQFWKTQNLINLIKSSDNRIYFISKYFFIGQEIQGGSVIKYGGDFQEWVNSCAKLQREYELNSGATDLPCWRIDKQPERDPKNKNKWYARIISCNQSGTEQNFFTKKFKPIEGQIPEKPKEPTKPTEATTPPEKELSPIDKEKLKREQLETLKSYKESIMKDIEFYEKHKRNTDDLWIEYERVSKQIKDLMK